jgi:NAD(P)-dependent dehydrogenase (short-subunit alcohol dehydrogenase family)
MKNIYDIFSVKNARVLVTGAANGNGGAISKAFAHAGSKLFLVDVDQEGLTNISNDIEENVCVDVDKAVVDLSNDAELNKFLEDHNDFDVVINNAGVSRGNSILDYNDADWDLTYRVNLFAPYKIIQKVSNNMVKRKNGSIINITSLAAEQGFPSNPAYVAFKGGLKQLTKAAACDLSPYNVRVNSVGPGYIKTNMTSKSWEDQSLRSNRTNRTIVGRWGEPDDLVGLIIFLASQSSSYITGQDFYVDGGWLAKGL